MKLGQHLVNAGVIDQAQLAAGLARAQATGVRLGAALIALGVATGDEVAAALAAQHGVTAARERQLTAATPALAARIPVALARSLRAVPIGEGRDRELVVALENPLDVDGLAAIEAAVGRPVIPCAASTAGLDAAIARLYPGAAGGTATPPPAPALPAPNAEPALLDLDDEPAVIEAPPAPPGASRKPSPTQPLKPIRPDLRRTGSNPAIPTTRTMQTIAGGTSLADGPDAPARSTGAAVRYGLGLAAVVASAVLGYQRCTRDDSYAIAPLYESTYLRATLPMPGPGWRGHPSLRSDRNGDAGRWTRLEGFFRGDSVDDATEQLVVLRIHAPGMFPEQIDPAQFRGQVDALGKQVVGTLESVSATSLECERDAGLRPEPAAICSGLGRHHDAPANIRVYYWEATVDDIVGVIHLATKPIEGRADELATFVGGIQIE